MTGRHQHFYSHILGRDTHAMVYGHGGKPVMVLPSQDGSGQDFEGFGMLPSCEPFLSQGQITLYCVDAIDRETWSNYSAPPRDRMALHERWIAFLTREFLPFMKADTGWQGRAMATGCSMGATHAANLVLRFPQLFDSLIALSGAYDASWLMYGYMDDLVYLNSPVHFIPNLSQEDPYVNALNSCRMVFCAGQGAWEEEMLRSLGLLKAAFEGKGIHAWVDIWGEDVNHDWPWWRRQMAYFLPKVMEGVRA